MELDKLEQPKYDGYGQLTIHHYRQNCCRQWQSDLPLVSVLVLLEGLLEVLLGVLLGVLLVLLKVVFRLLGCALPLPPGQTWLQTLKRSDRRCLTKVK